MSDGTQTHTNGVLWRRGAIRGFAFALIFTLAFEAMRAMGVEIRLSTPYVVVIGAVGGLAWALAHAGLRIFLNATLSKLSAQTVTAENETGSKDQPHG